MKAAVDSKIKIAIPSVNERKQIHVINPVSGPGNEESRARRLALIEESAAKTGGRVVQSTAPGNIEEIVANEAARDPFVHIVSYGGDGTVYETVNGLMKSGASSTASFSVIPVGSGNDFSAYANDSGVFSKSELNKIDIIRTKSGDNIRHFANMMNIGFDCSVVQSTYSLKKKPFLGGSTAYIAGVALTLLRKKSVRIRATLYDVADIANENRTIPSETVDKKLLLTFTANAQFCGGGFHSAPISSITDGFMDVLFVDNMSRLRFVSLVGDYKSGMYIDEQGHIKDRFAKKLTYKRCRRLKIEGASAYCLDGEIYPTADDLSLEAEVLPSALWYAAL